MKKQIKERNKLNMKKALGIIFVLCIVLNFLSLSSCGKGSPSGKEDSRHANVTLDDPFYESFDPVEPDDYSIVFTQNGETAGEYYFSTEMFNEFEAMLREHVTTFIAPPEDIEYANTEYIEGYTLLRNGRITTRFNKFIGEGETVLMFKYSVDDDSVDVYTADIGMYEKIEAFVAFLT